MKRLKELIRIFYLTYRVGRLLQRSIYKVKTNALGEGELITPKPEDVFELLDRESMVTGYMYITTDGQLYSHELSGLTTIDGKHYEQTEWLRYNPISAEWSTVKQPRAV